MDNTLQERDFQSPEYKRSRKAYLLECAFEYFVSLLVTEAFLAKVLTSIGVDDSLIGVIASLIALSQLFQLFTVFVVQKIRNTKRFVVLFHSLGQLMFMALYFVPFLPFAKEYKTVIAMFCILAAYFGNYFVTNIIYNWGNSYVEPHHRGRFGATKEMISLISGMVMTMIIGAVMDRFEALDNLEGGFIFAAIGILIFCICDFICLMMIKNEIRSDKEVKHAESLLTVFKKLSGMRSFWNILILTVLWNMAMYTSVGFLGTYRIKELAYTVGTVQLFNIIGNLGRFAFSKPFGRYADKHTVIKSLRLALLVAAASFAVNVFTTPDTRYLIIVHTFLYCTCFAGMSVNMFNISYSYIPREYYVQSTAIRNSIGGICGFLVSILAGMLLEHIQSSGNTFLGIPVYGQQVLSLFSLLLTVCAILFTKFVVEKQKSMVQ